jgi:hypothetical protein
MQWAEQRKGIRQEGRQLLGALGDDVGQVAASLTAVGVRGKPGSTEGCAIAVYLAAVVGADPGVSSITVDGRHLRIRLRSRRYPAVRLRLPDPVREFISAFDAKRYPSLVRVTPSQSGTHQTAKLQVTAAKHAR